MPKAKQVIVMRTDLNMRKGKMIAQGSHASIAWLTEHGASITQHPYNEFNPDDDAWQLRKDLTHAQRAWIQGQFTKICVRVDSEEALHAIVAKAQEAKLTVSLIQDAGLTEFGGVPTYTCCAIGPHWEEDIDPITQDLKLL